MTTVALLFSANAAGYQLPSRLLAPSQRSARHLPPRLDDSELRAVGERATSALDAALAGLSATPNESYLTQEERDEMLKGVDAKRFGDKPPPPPPPPADDGWRGISLNQDVMEERLSAPVTLDERPPSSDTPMSSSAPSKKPYDAMQPLTPGAGAPVLRKASVGDEVLGPPPKPYVGVRALQLDSLERANLLMLLYLLAAGFGSSSSQLLDEGLVFALRLAASALMVGHVASAGYGVKLITEGAPPPATAEGGDGGDDAPPRGVAAAAAWSVRLLLTGPAGLRTLRRRF